jgi:DNA-binding IclR family transcriptional regulator
MTTTEAHERTGRPPSGRPDGSTEPDPLNVRALARGLSILSLFDVDHREWTIDEIAARSGLLRMTAYRMARTLEAAEYLVRDAATNRYHLGPATIAMAYVAEDHSAFVDLARPFLEELVETTGESVTLAVPVDGIPVCVSIVDSPRPFQRQLAVGRVIGDLASVHGKIFAAFSPAARRAEILARVRRRHTPHTVTDPRLLAEELDAIARDDLAVDEEGLYLSTCAVGAPVRDQVGTVVAAVSVVMPTGRFGAVERSLCSRAVRDTAAALSAYLGWNPPRPTSASLD